MSIDDQILKLVQQALDEVDQPEARLSSVLNKAIRVARLRNDFESLYWLQMEATTWSKEVIADIEDGIRPHFLAVEFEQMRQRATLRSLQDRSVEDVDEEGQRKNRESVTHLGVGEIEATVRELRSTIEGAVTPTNLHQLDAYFMEKTNATARAVLTFRVRAFEGVLSRIRVRIHDFLSVVEQQLLFGQLNADIFDRNREYVQQRLASIAPDALQKMHAASRRLLEGEPEANSHAVESCRRLLKSIADALYPAHEVPVKGVDGKERVLTEDMYISRLWQFVTEKAKAHRSGKLLRVSVQDLGHRIDRLYELMNKGVHAEVDDFEVQQCVIQTWMITGDLLRLEAGNSAVTEESENELTYSGPMIP